MWHLQMQAKGFWGREFEILDEAGRPLAEIDMHVRWFGEDSRFKLGGEEYQLLSKGWTGGKLEMVRGGQSLARATRASLWREALDVDLSDRRLKLQPAGFWSRRFELKQGDRVCGQIERQGWFGRRIGADLPEEIPLAERIFIAWLALILWNRSDEAGSAVIVASG